MNNHTAHNDTKASTGGSFLRRNGRRLAAAAIIATAGSAGAGAIASAEPHVPGPHFEDFEPVVPDFTVDTMPRVTIALPEPSIPDSPVPIQPEVTIPAPSPPGPPDGPPTDTIPGALDPHIPDFPEIPTDPIDPEDPEDYPGDETTDTTVPESTTSTTVPETTVPETTQPEYPEVEVEERQQERSDAKELAYTGSDSKLPLVGAGLVAAGGMVGGLSLLARRSRVSEG